jgi:hypothetical protein
MVTGDTCCYIRYSLTNVSLEDLGSFTNLNAMNVCRYQFMEGQCFQSSAPCFYSCDQYFLWWLSCRCTVPVLTLTLAGNCSLRIDREMGGCQSLQGNQLGVRYRQNDSFTSQFDTNAIPVLHGTLASCVLPLADNCTCVV